MTIESHEEPREDKVRLLEGRTSPHWTVQLDLLTQAIDAQPDVPVNYLLRGDEWLVLGDCDRARADYEQARRLAETCLARSAWGYIYQAYIDRANMGLHMCGEGWGG